MPETPEERLQWDEDKKVFLLECRSAVITDLMKQLLKPTLVYILLEKAQETSTELAWEVARALLRLRNFGLVHQADDYRLCLSTEGTELLERSIASPASRDPATFNE